MSRKWCRAMSFCNCISSEGKRDIEEGFLTKSVGGDTRFKCLLSSWWMWPVGQFQELLFLVLFFVLLFFTLVVSNYCKSALILAHTWLLEVCLETESARAGWDVLWWSEVQQEEQFGVCQWTCCDAPPVANRWALKFELKQSLKPEGGRDCLFSKAVFGQCCGADLWGWQKLLLLSEGTPEQSDLDLGIHMAHVQISVGLITGIREEIVILV